MSFCANKNRWNSDLFVFTERAHYSNSHKESNESLRVNVNEELSKF